MFTITDEFHFTLICSFYKKLRQVYVEKIVLLISVKLVKLMCKLGKYVYKCSKSLYLLKSKAQQAIKFLKSSLNRLNIDLNFYDINIY